MAKQVLIFIQMLLALSAQAESAYVRGEFLSIEEAEKKWGHASFSEEKFKKASPSERSTLIVDLIRSKKLEGAPLTTIRELLGPQDGYFLDDTIPAYLLGTRKPGEKKDVWQIVLIPDEVRTKVIEVKIHKNCCYGSH